MSTFMGPFQMDKNAGGQRGNLLSFTSNIDQNYQAVSAYQYSNFTRNMKKERQPQTSLLGQIRNTACFSEICFL